MEREQTTIRLPKILKDKLERLADSMGCSLNCVILYLLERAFESL